MLKQDDGKDHECDRFSDFQNGEFQCLSEHNKIKKIHQKIENFKFRDK